MSTTYTEWARLDDNETTAKTYRCGYCRENSGRMMVRTVTGGDGHMHKEYLVQCTKCRKKGGAHWNKNMAMYDWDAMMSPDDVVIKKGVKNHG